ncbi:MAG: ADP-glyceromanno-heptose 6-epimerase [Alphaproteobacteria bacterium]
MIIVTGGAGFIGSNIVAELNAAGRGDVTVVDWFGTDDKWKNLAKAELDEIVPPEALDDLLARRSNDISGIVHMGAISATTEADVDLIVRSNIILTIKLWDFCVGRGIPFIYASSAATYGDGDAGFDDEMGTDALSKLKPMNPYGWSKHMIDRRIARIVSEGGAAPPRWAGLKFFNVYGPNEYHKGSMKSVIAHIYPDVAADKGVSLFKSHRDDYEDGGQLRDFVYVRDCAKVVRWMLEADHMPSGLYNIGTGQARSFADLAGATFTAAGKPAQISYRDMPLEIRDRYQYFTEAKMDRLRQAGYREEFFSLEDGVKDYVENFLGCADPYR